MKIIFYFIAISTFFVVSAQEKLSTITSQSEYSYQYALIEASRQKMIGNVSEAINLYLSCISSNPLCDVAYYELGTVYSALGENTNAEKMLAKAYEIDNGNYWYSIAYSELLNVNKKNSESLKILKKAKKLNESNSLTVDFKIAEIYLKKKRYNKAVSLLENLERQNGVSEMISLKKFEIFKLQRKNSKAEAVIMELINSAPDIIDYQIILAEFYAQNKDSLKALNIYEMAYRVDSSNIYAITNLADLYSNLGNDEKAYFFLNQAFLNENISLESKLQTMMFINKDRDLIRKKRFFIEKLIENLLIGYPDNIEVYTVAYDFYNGLDEHQKALEIIKAVLLTVKDDYAIWQQALYSASMLENYDELIFIGENALRYFPNKSEFYFFVGLAYFQKEQYEEAYNLLSLSLPALKNEDKLKEQVLVFLGEASYKTQRKTEAYSYFDQLLEMSPSNDFIKNNYSYYLALDSVNLLKAKELSYATINNSPDNSTFLDTYAWILFKIGNYDSAKYYSEKALKINNEKDSDIIFHYAEILYALKEFILSEKYFKLAGELGYDKAIIRKKLKID